MVNCNDVSGFPLYASAIWFIALLYLLFKELGAVSLDGYFHLWKAEHNLFKVK